MRKRDLAILMLSAFAIFFSLQQDGGVSFKDAWFHLTDEYPIKYEAERLPPPLVADLNGDGKKEVLVATHDAKIQILEPHSRRVDEGFSEARVLAEVSLLPDKVRVMSGRRPVAMATGYIDRHKIGQPHKQVLVVVTSGWFVMCFDSNLQKLWENNLQEDFPHNAHHREVSISVSNYTLKHGDTGLIIVGGRMEMQPNIFMDPFEEMGMGARFAEQHRRSASEKEASENTGTVDLRHFAFYAFAGRSGVERWSRKNENIEAASSDASQLIPQHNYKLDVHALNRRQPGEVIGGAVIVIMLPLVALTTQSASYVFTNFELAPNTTGISSKPYAVILSFLVSQYSLYGYDAAAHLTEETKGADKNGPIAILGSLAIISVFGWAYILALTFSIQDFAYLYDPNNETAGAFVPAQILYDAFHGRYHNSAGAIVLLFIIWGSFFFGGLSITTSAARVVYALSRDKGVPFSFLWRKLHPKHKVPTNAVWLCAAICILLGLPILKD